MNKNYDSNTSHIKSPLTAVKKSGIIKFHFHRLAVDVLSKKMSTTWAQTAAGEKTEKL